MIKWIAIPLIVFLNSIKVNAFCRGLNQDSLKKITLTLAALYSNNVSYYGQTTAEKLPYVLANATLRFPLGVYISAGSYKLLNQGSGISETDLGLGFDYDFNDKLTAGIGYTHSFFPSGSQLLQASNNNNIGLNTSYSWSWLKTTLTADYAFGTEQDVFIGLANARTIDIGSLFDANDVVSIQPEIEIIAGTQHFYESYTVEKEKRNKGKGKGAGNENTPVTTLVPVSSFNLLSYNFKLPLSYSRASYMAEISYQFSVLGKNAVTEAKRQQSFINLGFYYQF